MKTVTELQALKFDNLMLRGQAVGRQIRDLQDAGKTIQADLAALLEAMRREVGAEKDAPYDPRTKSFAPPRPPAVAPKKKARGD